ncbi:hypothetical protein XENTR_v10017500 [Xenopus tropicalis]|nr:hypothetical protein XENTR_v10017500 [Xenopus tropicalis]
MSMAFNPSSHMVPLMLDTPESTCTPPPSCDSRHLLVQRAGVAHLTGDNGGIYEVWGSVLPSQHPAGSIPVPPVLPVFPVPATPPHSLTPTSPEEPLSYCARGVTPPVCWHTGALEPSCQAEPGHILLQSGTGGITFHASPWSDMYYRTLPFQRSQIGGPCNLASSLSFLTRPPILPQPQKASNPSQAPDESGRRSHGLSECRSACLRSRKEKAQSCGIRNQNIGRLFTLYLF